MRHHGRITKIGYGQWHVTCSCRWAAFEGSKENGRGTFKAHVRFEKARAERDLAEHCGFDEVDE